MPQVQTSLSGTDGSELLVQVLDRLAVAPRFQVKPELSHVLEVRLYLLLRGDPKSFHAKPACPLNVACCTCAVARAASSPWPGLDYARVEGGQGRCQHVLRGVRLSKPRQRHAAFAGETVGVKECKAGPA